jgi:hypothetical protein
MTKGIYKSQKQKEEERTKLLQVINALGGPISVHEIIAHPLLKGTVSTRAAGQHLKYLAKIKEVRFKGKQMWAPIQKRELPAKQQRRKPKTAVAVTEAPSGMFFILNPTTQTVMLDVGGLRLPVIIEH